MLISLDDLTGWRATTGTRSLNIRDVFFAPDSLEVSYVLVSDGAWTDPERMLVAASYLGDADPDAREIPLRISDDELSRAPRWDSGQGPLASFLTTLPPLVVGPFGATHAPLPLAAEAMAQPSDDTDERSVMVKERFDRLGDWLGKPVFARDGEVGVVRDLLYDPEQGRIAHLIVGDDKMFNATQTAIPVAEIAHRVDDEKGGHVVLTCGMAAIPTFPAPGDLMGEPA